LERPFDTLGKRPYLGANRAVGKPLAGFPILSGGKEGVPGMHFEGLGCSYAGPHARGSGRKACLALLVPLILLVPATAHGDTVVLRDDTRLEGIVLALDEESIRLRTASGEVLQLPRERVARIVFDQPSPPLKVEVRCPMGDDEFDLLLNGDPVMENVALTASPWVDVSDRLQNGNNEFRPRIRNFRSTWAYRWQMRINGRVSVFSCGQPRLKGKGCSCCGLEGNERGTIEGLDPVWLHVDRALGTAEVLGR
jgi:hypothetical protein